MDDAAAIRALLIYAIMALVIFGPALDLYREFPQWLWAKAIGLWSISRKIFEINCWHYCLLYLVFDPREVESSDRTFRLCGWIVFWVFTFWFVFFVLSVFRNADLGLTVVPPMLGGFATLLLVALGWFMAHPHQASRSWWGKATE